MSEAKNDTDDKNEIQTGWLIPTAIIFVLFISACPYFLSNSNDIIQTYFSFVTSFFAGLAFIGVMFTLILQKKELDATRKVMKEQSETMELQRFETTFFNLLMHLDLQAKSLEFIKEDESLLPQGNYYIGDGYHYKEKSVFTGIREHVFRGHFFDKNPNEGLILAFHVKNTNLAQIEETNLPFLKKKDIDRLGGFFKAQKNLKPYYSILLNILVYVSQAKILESEKEFFYDLVLSQFTDDERFILNYFAVTESGKQFRKYIKKYNWFSNRLVSPKDKELLISLPEE